MVWITDDFLEGLHIVRDTTTGLSGVIAVHSTALGPAAGGCRVWDYPDQQALVTDAIRLARGMSYKNALAGLPFGGGKAVLQQPPAGVDRAAMFGAFGAAVEALGGGYVTAEDVGTGIADMTAAQHRTRYVAGLDPRGAAAGGDPSPWTALGVFECMSVAAAMHGVSLSTARVAVQGVGNVGAALCRLLVAVGADLVVADVDSERAQHVAQEVGARVVDPDEILATDADIVAPCGLGGSLNDASIAALRAPIVCGAANNQLAEDRHGEMLRRRGVLYAPDYVVNAGGIINVCAEYLGEGTDRVRARIAAMAPRFADILRVAADRKQPTNRVANTIAQETIAASRRRAA